MSPTDVGDIGSWHKIAKNGQLVALSSCTWLFSLPIRHVIARDSSADGAITDLTHKSE